mmetsp:Transcript_8396/g.22422  ORF Transcript_8396/g.22422 Transcript_8396/m.22422 type:complete len:226 (+) Transcript_8396:949-1626(+)
MQRPSVVKLWLIFVISAMRLSSAPFACDRFHFSLPARSTSDSLDMIFTLPFFPSPSCSSMSCSIVCDRFDRSLYSVDRIDRISLHLLMRSSKNSGLSTPILVRPITSGRPLDIAPLIPKLCACPPFSPMPEWCAMRSYTFSLYTSRKVQCIRKVPFWRSMSNSRCTALGITPNTEPSSGSTSSTAAGVPLASGWRPTIVYVLPVPVWPYANIVAFTPSMTESTTS